MKLLFFHVCPSEIFLNTVYLYINNMILTKDKYKYVVGIKKYISSNFRVILFELYTLKEAFACDCF